MIFSAHAVCSAWTALQAAPSQIKVFKSAHASKVASIIWLDHEVGLDARRIQFGCVVVLAALALGSATIALSVEPT